MLDETIWFMADNWFFETIIFSFVSKGQVFQGRIGYGVLEEKFCREVLTRDISTLFACNRDQIRRAASQKVIDGNIEPIEIELQDM